MIDKMLEAEIWSITRIDQGNAVLLRPLGADLVVPIFVGPLEVHAILLGLGNVKAKRPLSCDLFLDLICRLGIVLFRVEVHEIQEDIFHARLFLSGRDYPPSNPLIIDSRPSDAFALAVRGKCPVFMAAKILNRVGIPADIFIGAESKADKTPPIIKKEAEAAAFERGGSPGEKSSGPRGNGEASLAAKRRRLQAELEETIEREAYERSAEIRDILVLLDQQIEQERRKKEAPGGGKFNSGG
jgi:bifunctional DNase/RNase